MHDNARRFASFVAERKPVALTISFPGVDGQTLRGWFVPPKSGAVLILIHGLGGNRVSPLPACRRSGHGGYVQAEPAEYERRVLGFWDRYLGR